MFQLLNIKQTKKNQHIIISSYFHLNIIYIVKLKDGFKKNFVFNTLRLSYILNNLYINIYKGDNLSLNQQLIFSMQNSIQIKNNLNKYVGN